MKKLLLIISLVILSNCKIEPNSVSAQTNWYQEDELYITYREERGMKFMIMSKGAHYSSPFIVNLTKEELEVQLLRKQLAK